MESRGTDLSLPLNKYKTYGGRYSFQTLNNRHHRNVIPKNRDTVEPLGCTVLLPRERRFQDTEQGAIKHSVRVSLCWKNRSWSSR